MPFEVYKIKDHKNNRKLVYLDEEAPAFCLYLKELKKYNITEGSYISEKEYDEIISLLSKRARERCLYLLESMARTEKQLRDKLKEGYYPEEAIDFAIDYCKSKHYVDDRDYAERFITSRSRTLSKRAIEQKLYLKGIRKEIIDEAFLINEPDESAVITELLRKKYSDITGYSYEEKQKVIKKFLNKGFSYEAIKSAIISYSEKEQST
ncbi:MAG: recombination regulator RecX [Lachnospiraceae bacterium]|nr:recombination regulator RecX [Lachnospiraceae bacterium]